MPADGYNAGVTRRAFLAAAGGAAVCAGSADAAPADGAHEAAHYTRLPNGSVKCGLCPRACIVAPGRRGHCRVRENRAGRYVSLVYGRACAANNDPIEKKPFFHVYPGSKAYSIATVGCNMRCRFCQNWDIAQADPRDVEAPYTAPADVAEAAVRAGSQVVACTYSEPTVFYEYAADCARAARDRGLGTVIVSNGYIQPKPLEQLIPLLTAYKVDFKAYNPDFYTRLCEGRLGPVLDTLKLLAHSGLWLEIVVLLIPTQNDGMDEIKRMAAWIVKELRPDVPLHFTRFHPAYQLRNLPPTPPETLRRARATALAEGCRFVYTGNLPGNEGEHTYCPQCKAVVVNRYGHMAVRNDLRGGRCPSCGTAIPGVWG